MINRRDDSDQSCWSIPYRESMTCPSQGLYFEMTDTKASLGWSRGCGGPLGGGYIIVYLMKKMVENCGGILEKYTMTLTLKMGIANLGRSYRLPCAFKKFNQIPQSNVHPIHI